MTPSELRATGAAIYGVGWQTKMAADFEVTPRTIRRAAAKDGTVPDWLEAKITAKVGAFPRPAHRRDKWIVGDGAEGREYVIHAHSPVFIARVVETLDGEDVTDETADTISGTTFDAEDFVLCEIDWVDGRPTDEVMKRLLEQAAEAVRSV